VLVVVALVGAATFVVVNSGDDGEKVVLEPIGMVQEDDFSGNLDAGEGTGEAVGAVFADFDPSEHIPDARVEEVGTRLAGQVVSGVEPAVYGGSRDTQVCDTVTLVDFLTDPENADKAEAWTGALGIEIDEIQSYVDSLTAVRLRWDTRVTNHGFRDGEAYGFQSLLQAGTGVLVDDTGVPRVKCNCGNPLGEPTETDGGGSGDLDLGEVADNPDDAWEKLDPAQAVAIQPGDDTVEDLTLVDVETNGLIERPVGSDGASKRDVGTGDVQFTLTWSSVADLDLAVKEPDGTEIWFGSPGPSATGGELDVDSNVGCADDGAVENVFWPPGEAPSGTYTVLVRGYSVDGCGAGDYTLSSTIGGESTTETGSVGQDAEKSYPFEVP
jgi:hypothetical protein